MAQSFMSSGTFRDNFSTQSPGPIRPPPILHRQPSRNFESVRSQNDMAGMFGNDDPMGRYDSPSMPSMDRFNSNTIHGTRVPGFNLGYDTLPSHNFTGATGHFDNNLMNAVGQDGTSFQSRMRPVQARNDVRNLWPGSSQQFPQPRQPGGINRPEGLGANTQGDDQLIATAIVIKNIPFALKKEELQHHMNCLGLPAPYAFNYHFDNGVFRGLAFANFTSAHDTEVVIRCLDGYMIDGRRLKVEYKKMLPQEERERIERLKREKRGQLEEQHRPLGPNQLHNQTSMSSMSSQYASRVTPSPGPQLSGKSVRDIDYNDPTTRGFFQTLALFNANPGESQRVFHNIAPTDRFKLHSVAHEMGLEHNSEGQGDGRHVIVSKVRAESPQDSSYFGMINGADANRKTLARAATMEFAERNDGSLRPQYSLGQLGDTLPTFGNVRDRERDLQRSKSHAELQRGFTPSPAPSTTISNASFTSAMQSNAARYQQLDGAGGLSTVPSITHTGTNSGLGLRDDFLSKGFSSMTISNPTINGSPRRARDPFSGFANDSQPFLQTAPIGSNRTTNSNDRNPSRHPQGPPADGGQGFERRNGQGRGSDEMRRDMKGTMRADP